MPALTAKHADQLTLASVALARIAECVPSGATIMRGTLYGRDGAELELQFSALEDVQMTVEVLRCGLQHEIAAPERGQLTGQLMRRHRWVGQVGADPGGVPVTLWAYELIDELPEPKAAEGARFPVPVPTAESTALEARASA